MRSLIHSRVRRTPGGTPTDVGFNRWARAMLGLGGIALASLPASTHAQQQTASPIIPITDAGWNATDDLGRTLPTYKEVGAPKPNRWVGLFYWQWHGDLRHGPDYDMTEFLKTHPGFKDFDAHPKGGPDFPTFYWAQPIWGYYRSTDPWVIRKQLTMISQAGVDFLFLDYTNGSVYDAELETFLNVARDLQKQGIRVPRLTFFLNSEPEWKIESLYNRWYRPGKYDDLWFQWQGKPLLMTAVPTDPTKFRDNKTPEFLNTIAAYFTFRPTWAFQNEKKEPTKWRFMDEHPTRPALGPDGKVEQLAVTKSLGGPLWKNMDTASVSAVPGHIPVYNDQWISPDAPRGLFFAEQWKVAHKIAPPILLVTGWNEWTASVWETPGVVMLRRTTEKGQGHIVDEFNQEFNRDLEPMKGGYRDNYYWQFVAEMRRYKGMLPPPPPSAPRTISIDGKFQDWNGVAPTYWDTVGDTAGRDFDGTVKGVHYTYAGGRNDLAVAQVARDTKAVYFHAHTAAPLASSTSKGKLWLFIDTDTNPKTGWHGYDLLIGHSRTAQGVSVEQYAGTAGNWNWKKSGSEVRFSASERDVELALPRALFGKHPLRFDFKWADDLPDTPDIMDFYTKGDVAPDTRFNYRFEENNAR